jgi:hypothetical protein
MSNQAHDLATALRRKWQDIFNAGQIEPLLLLYAPDGHLFGSQAELYAGRDNIRTYFANLPLSDFIGDMKDHSAIMPTENVLISSGFVDFARRGRQVVPFRLSLTWVRMQGDWLIAQHHGSARRPSIGLFDGPAKT